MNLLTNGLETVFCFIHGDSLGPQMTRPSLGRIFSSPCVDKSRKRSNYDPHTTHMFCKSDCIVTYDLGAVGVANKLFEN
jgi:hypothetical protein